MIEIKKIEIAKELLESALYHYYDSQQYFSSIQCAGAAEEILGQYIEINGGESAFEKQNKDVRKITKILNGSESPKKDITYVMNFAKNSTKHMDKDADETLVLDPKLEAEDLLDRAVTNYYNLMPHLDLNETNYIKRYNKVRV